ncbi:MAG TPA: fumarylacetoacetate hydrolase family protein [Candidatus Hydrogenedentes bacterium]|jgi:2-keto-4-pentenoate hydratase/2-oxohepta-3-ene-1,7-dioic acid hydratase in catechol pathway|nr:fumarylacetoacetate hydrolase family protein [Candidatus Hydrogenedentota bacterium]HPK00696.1 fumarylacetoacetate hydrolase family protein [Candidatus Hydrogenedentota bacterium]
MRLARILDKNNQVVYAAEQKDGRLLKIEGDISGGESRITDEAVEPSRWLPPLDPTAILCIGLNYRKHAEEGGVPVPEYPVLFMKNPATATGHREPIELPAVCTDEVDYEAELAVVIGKPACNVSKKDALDCVLGYMCSNDVSARIWQSKLGGSQWCRGKSFNTFAPLGPLLVTRDELPNPNALAIKSILNGETMQSSNTKDMIFDVPTLISFLSEDTTLLPGTVILTGTPEGVGWARNPKVVLKPGDTIAVEIEGLGRLENPVTA